MSVRALPAMGPEKKLQVPREVERRLANGLTVLAVRRPAVPLVEVRLRIPFGRAHLARATLLAQTLFSGTAALSTRDIAAGLQAVGGGLSASVDPDRLLVAGNGLVTGLDRILEILADVLTAAAYPGDEVNAERERLIDRIQVARSQPAHLVRAALLKRMYGKHPYAVQTPEPAQVRAVRPAQLRALHVDRVLPDGATLVIVGDLQPGRALDAAERALGGWGRGRSPGGPPPAETAETGPLRAGGPVNAAFPADLPPVPPLVPGPLLLVDRPEAVQSSLRLALPGVGRTHPDHAALQLANLIFGGYFSSRWVENIREDKGYTYGPFSLIEHGIAGSALVVTADVATEVTGPAMLETLYELGRLASLPPKDDELEQARQYALGSLRLSMSTQAGLAGLASTYASFGLRLEFLTEYLGRLAGATRDEVAAAAAKYLAPARAVGVVLGDARRVEESLSVLLPVDRQPTS